MYPINECVRHSSRCTAHTRFACWAEYNILPPHALFCRTEYEHAADVRANERLPHTKTMTSPPLENDSSGQSKTCFETLVPLWVPGYPMPSEWHHLRQKIADFPAHCRMWCVSLIKVKSPMEADLKVRHESLFTCQKSKAQAHISRSCANHFSSTTARDPTTFACANQTINAT